MRLAFWKLVLSQARRNVRAVVREHTGPFVSVAAVGLAGILGVYLAGSPGAWVDDFYNLIGALALVGVGAIAWFVWELFSIPPKLLDEANKAARQGEVENAALRLRLNQLERPQQRTDEPTWTLFHLFDYLMPDLLDRDESEAPWNDVGELVRSKMALGRLGVWGQRANRDDLVGSLVGEHRLLPHEKIENSYWYKADFSYLFLSKDKEEAEHTLASINLPNYHNVMVNESEAREIWPTPLAGTEWDRQRLERWCRDQLWKLVRSGAPLRNEGVTTTETYSWTKEFTAWREEVLVVAGKLSPDLRGNLDTMDRMDPLPEKPVIGGDHATNVNVVNDMLARLRRYLNR